MSDNPRTDLAILFYTPREDAEQRGYHKFLVETDNPFFNSVPGIREYTNWQLVSSATSAVPYSHFDLLYLDSPDSFDRVWQNESLQAFAGGWVKDWGRYPDIDPERMDMNFSVLRCVHVSGPQHPQGQCLAVFPSRSDRTKLAGATVYRVVDAVVGDVRYPYIVLLPIKADTEFEAMTISIKPPLLGGALGEVIAAPEGYPEK